MSYGKWMILIALAAMVLSSLACTDSKGGVADLVKPTPASPPSTSRELPNSVPVEELPNPAIEQLKENWDYNTGQLEQGLEDATDSLEDIDFERLCPVVSEIVRKAESGEYAEQALDGLIDGQNTIKTVAKRCFELGDSLQDELDNGDHERN